MKMLYGPMTMRQQTSPLDKDSNPRSSVIGSFYDSGYPHIQPLTPHMNLNPYELGPSTPSFDFSPMSPFDAFAQIYPGQGFGNFNLNLGLSGPVTPTNLSGINPPSVAKLVLEPGLMKPKRGISPPPVAEKATLYKTELCKKWMTTGTCRYGGKCQFAHGHDELRTLIRHPLYKTTACKTFQTTGVCRYGSRCRFIHDESDIELNSVPRMAGRNNFQNSLLPEASLIDQSTNSTGSVNDRVRFNEDSSPEPVTNIQTAEISSKIGLRLGKRVPSAPASLNLMGLDPETLNLGMDEEGYDFAYQSSSLEAEELKASLAAEKNRILRQAAIKRNLTFQGLNNLNLTPLQRHELSEKTGNNFKLSSAYKHNSASVTDFTKNWNFNEHEEEMPVVGNRVESTSPPLKSSMRANLSSSRLQQMQHVPFQNLAALNNNLGSESRLRHNTDDNVNVQMNFFRSISNPELTDLN